MEPVPSIQDSFHRSKFYSPDFSFSMPATASSLQNRLSKNGIKIAKKIIGNKQKVPSPIYYKVVFLRPFLLP